MLVPTMGGHGDPHNKCRARCLHLAAARCWHRALQGRRMRGKKTDEHCSSLRWEGTQTLPYKIKRRYAYQMYGRRMRDKKGRAPTELQQRKTDRRALNALQFRLQQQDRQKQGTALQAAILSFRRINGITYLISSACEQFRTRRCRDGSICRFYFFEGLKAALHIHPHQAEASRSSPRFRRHSCYTSIPRIALSYQLRGLSSSSFGLLTLTLLRSSFIRGIISPGIPLIAVVS